MSVKELCARLSVLLVVCAFAVSAKATPTIEPIVGEDKGYTITINEPADFDIFNSGDNVFYTEEDGTVIKVSEIKELAIVTKNPHKLDKNKATTLMANCSSLDYLDLENCSVAGVDNTGNVNPFLSNDGNPNPFKNKLKTLVFPKDAGMIIPSGAFKGDTKLETVIFPDNSGTYQIMAYAFQDCQKLKTVSMGKGYTIPDMAMDNSGQWKSATGSGLSIFEHCKKLENVVIDNSIVDLGEKAFSATYALEYLVLPESLVHIGNLCFKECGIRTVTIPDNVIIGKRDQIFQGCIQLRNIFVNADNIEVPIQGLMEMAQTFNFNWAGHDQTCSINDYQAASAFTGSDYSDSPFKDKYYSVPILHYPGTNTAITNYRCPFYMHYSGKHDATDTTWPNQQDLSIKENGSVNDQEAYGGSYTGFYNTPGFAPEESEFAGWKQFLIGNNIFKEQKVFYDERIKESRWYSICLPINMTEAQFMNAYGVGAALHEFTGAEYDEESNMIVLKFDTPATEDANGYLLKKNVPYMIHPAKIKFTKRKEVQLDPVNGGVEFVKETVDGQEQYATTEVIATFDVESDLFVNWNTLLNGGQPFADAIAEVESKTTAALEENAQTRRFTNDKFPSVDYTFRGSYLGATIYGPADAGGKQKQMGTSPTLPVGAYYLGYQSGMSEPKFFKAKGTAVWSPYCALVEAADVAAGGGNGAKEFNVLSVDFNKSDVVVTKIGSPTIQIPVIKSDSKIYNLNGQVVRENSKDTSGLKGIYVVGGKKVIFN